ncbi:hypothetical protein C8R44DRAFT_727385 [Mycena epipterygia]|nr:hypothetical protein C8R44DRAFT_727385 [Mycena epipterygia]
MAFAFSTAISDLAMVHGAEPSHKSGGNAEDFAVGALGPWSDHAPLTLKFMVPDTPPVLNPGLPYLREKLREAKESEAYLDVLLCETLESKKTPAERQAVFYGPVYDSSTVGKSQIA